MAAVTESFRIAIKPVPTYSGYTSIAPERSALNATSVAPSPARRSTLRPARSSSCANISASRYDSPNGFEATTIVRRAAARDCAEAARGMIRLTSSTASNAASGAGLGVANPDAILCRSLDAALAVRCGRAISDMHITGPSARARTPVHASGVARRTALREHRARMRAMRTVRFGPPA